MMKRVLVLALATATVIVVACSNLPGRDHHDSEDADANGDADCDADGDIDSGADGDGDSDADGDCPDEPCVIMCHITEDHAEIICVDPDDVGWLIDHGDYLGPCHDVEADADADSDADEERYTIMCVDAGTSDAHMETVPESEVDEHLAQGDTLGPCPDAEADADADVDADGDGDADGDADADAECVWMCIINPGHDSDPYEWCMPAEDVETMLDMGSLLGDCPDTPADGDGDVDADGDSDGDIDADGDGDADGGGCDIPDCREGKVLICHVPPGNPDNAHWICVGRPAERAHEDHGDRDELCCQP